MSKRTRTFRLPPGDSRHGRNGYANYGCGCDICVEANRAAHAEYMHRKPDQRERHRNYQRRLRRGYYLQGLNAHGKPRQR